MMASQLPAPHPDRVRRLTAINVEDLLRSFRVDHIKIARGIFRLAARGPARWFARQVAIYDRLVGERGLAAGAAWILDRLDMSVSARDTHHVPDAGPVLVVSNHPGLGDTMALAATLPRTDLRYIAYRRPFLQELENTRRYLIEIDEEDSGRRMAGFRQAGRYLDDGGMVITFPGGRIDHDPYAVPGAIAALDRWSESIAVFVKRQPDLVILPVLIGGVLSRGALEHPLVQLYRSRATRQWTAATLQLVLPAYRYANIEVTYGEPLHATDLRGLKRQAVLEHTRDAMRTLIVRHGLPDY
ncbi:MAG: lysophospholipid acyltransferase family protein [Anaerolineae bacterium]